ncbi:hypothetical protein X772_35220 [Mesorhizobium sp. LSJC280B00]|nr:hypothetical protein X772_35220 [Mesorhizobium sp. LSJC280B00]
MTSNSYAPKGSSACKHSPCQFRHRRFDNDGAINFMAQAAS